MAKLPATISVPFTFCGVKGGGRSSSAFSGGSYGSDLTVETYDILYKTIMTINMENKLHTWTMGSKAVRLTSICSWSTSTSASSLSLTSSGSSFMCNVYETQHKQYIPTIHIVLISTLTISAIELPTFQDSHRSFSFCWFILQASLYFSHCSICWTQVEQTIVDILSSAYIWEWF